MDSKWKLMIVSIILYQGLLTWCLFSLVNTASYFARLECGDWCYDHVFGFILTNQGAYDTALIFALASACLIAVNGIVWIASVRRQGKSSRD
ncbi:hypothetical protein [Allorhizobium taibaishanense]|uniref:Uncharacterized protein n=1 Tax=Allorhizobium taibaishanense TaxID=887144 RepID=A0A1Q9A4G1_9HYPH|nr:hypothetical protein [Allorhizobium taibaishanense]MBB4006543.1 hypothetical protein [Allorhizobium taibaishanense]OLP49469.1 hypothetical protein BJF91_20780 [Allorhizobium taibaishanense]